VSYASVDEPWAVWIAEQLEDHFGFRVTLQAWHFRPGDNFVRQIERALEQSSRVVLLLSTAYHERRFTEEEWQASWATGSGRLLPIRIEDVDPRGLLASLVYIDFVGRNSAQCLAEMSRAFSPRGRTRGSVFPGSTIRGHSRPEPALFPRQKESSRKEWKVVVYNFDNWGERVHAAKVGERFSDLILDELLRLHLAAVHREVEPQHLVTMGPPDPVLSDLAQYPDLVPFVAVVGWVSDEDSGQQISAGVRVTDIDSDLRQMVSLVERYSFEDDFKAMRAAAADAASKIRPRILAHAASDGGSHTG
jgi:TIR domain